MKLIICSNCSDVRSLRVSSKTTCECGESYGQYEKDGVNAFIGGKAIPIGFANGKLIDAIRNRPKSGMGKEFAAFVIPEKCETITQF